MIPSGSFIQAVLWDIDGTLIDSEGLHYQVIAQWCGARGYNLTETDNRELVGKSMAEKWIRISAAFDTGTDEAGFRADCARDYARAVDSGLRRPGPMAVFQRVMEMRIPQACVSNGDPEVVRANLAALGLTDKVAFTITGADVSCGKPDPEPYKQALERLGLEPARCLGIEDSGVGIQAASSAGLVTIAWPGPEPDETGLDAADFRISTPEDFPWPLLKPPGDD